MYRQKLIASLFTCLLMFLPMAGQAATMDWQKDADIREEERWKQMEHFFEIYTYLQEYHVDQLSAEELIDNAIFGMLFFMDDPYTSYMDEQEYAEFVRSVNGEFVGIGVTVSEEESGFVIQEFLPGGPAAKSALRVGDVIVGVNGESIIGLSLEEATENILGEEGTSVSLTVQRADNGEVSERQIQLVRSKITLPHVETVWLDEKIAQLKLHRFGSETAQLLEDELATILKKDPQGIILDVRGNSGGMMDTLLEIAALFKEEGAVFYAKDNTGLVEAYEIKQGKHWNIPLVVLVNGESASAAEVLSGFLQDYGLATLVGEPTYGKGTMQTSIELETGGVLHLSIEEFFTPTMQTIRDTGIYPDVTMYDPSLQVAKAYGVLLGKDEILLNTLNKKVKFNGLEAEKASYQDYIKENAGNYYLSARMLSDWFGGIIDWDWERHALILTFAEEMYSLESGHQALLLADGSAFLELSYIQEYLPIKIEETNEGLLLIEK